MPVPEALDVIAAHETLLVAVQVASDGVAVTENVPVPAVAATLTAEGVSVKVAPAPACVIVNVKPATVTVPTRWLTDVLAVAAYCTGPLPVPVAPAVIVIHVALLTAVHGASGGAAFTAMLSPVAAAALMLAAFAPSENDGVAPD